MFTALECPGCGRPHAVEDLVCAMCGGLLRRATPTDDPVPSPAAPDHGEPSTPIDLRASLLALGGGALLAPVFTFTPILRYTGWFLGSLTHETGHAAAAWLCGCPAYPAIRLDGHAAAFHQPQQVVLALLVWAGLAWGTWAARHRLRVAVPLAVATLLYPLLAFTWLRELAHLLAGHLGELTFAVVFFWRALSGGFSPSLAERVTYGTVAWFLLGRNVALCFGLATSAAARAEYAGNGSFGLTNDYIRVAEDVLAWSVPSVALLMLVVSLAALPLAALLWRTSSCR